MFLDNEKKVFIVRYRFKGSKSMQEKNFSKESEAYGFYHGLDNVDFKVFSLKSVMTSNVVLLYERF